jgi:hypothetical protein
MRVRAGYSFLLTDEARAKGGAVGVTEPADAKARSRRCGARLLEIRLAWGDPIVIAYREMGAWSSRIARSALWLAPWRGYAAFNFFLPPDTTQVLYSLPCWTLHRKLLGLGTRGTSLRYSVARVATTRLPPGQC